MEGVWDELGAQGDARAEIAWARLLFMASSVFAHDHDGWGIQDTPERGEKVARVEIELYSPRASYPLIPCQN